MPVQYERIARAAGNAHLILKKIKNYFPIWRKNAGRERAGSSCALLNYLGFLNYTVTSPLTRQSNGAYLRQ